MQSGGKALANSQRGATASPCLEGTQLLAIGLPPGSSEKYSRFPAPASPLPVPALPAALPRPLSPYLRRSWARPHSARQNPNPCCGRLAGRPQPPARLRGAGSRRPGPGCPAQSVRSAGRRQPGRCGLGCARWPRPGGGSAEASAARSPLPAPAGRCLREGSAGRRVGRAWSEWGGERGGASGEEREPPAPRRIQSRVKYPGGGATPPTRARSPEPGLGERGEVARRARLIPFFLGVAKFGGFLGEKVPNRKMGSSE